MSEIMNGDEINEIERYIPSGNPDALHRPLRNVVASHRALQAKVRELEERLKDRDEQADVREPCVWTENDSGWWETTCQNAFSLTDGTPEDNGMNFCPYCGNHLKEQVHVREE